MCCFVHLWWVTVGWGVCSSALCECMPAGTRLCGSHSSRLTETRAHTESSWWAPVHRKRAKRGGNVTGAGAAAHRWLGMIECCPLSATLTETVIPLILKGILKNCRSICAFYYSWWSFLKSWICVLKFSTLLYHLVEQFLVSIHWCFVMRFFSEWRLVIAHFYSELEM